MGMPQVPDRPNRPSLEEILADLIESVAVEKLAMAHILNAEGERLQELIKQADAPCLDQLLGAYRGTSSVLNGLLMKEWVTIQKVQATLELYDMIGHQKSASCQKEEKFTHMRP